MTYTVTHGLVLMGLVFMPIAHHDAVGRELSPSGVLAFQADNRVSAGGDQSDSRETLTNLEIIRWVTQTIPDAIITARIHSATVVRFDLSENGLRILQGAEVSNTVLLAMVYKQSRFDGIPPPAFPFRLFTELLIFWW